MKISPVNINFTRLNFKGQNKPVTLGYDDDISGLRRDYIRRHYEETNLPNVDIFEREGRLEEYELNKLLKSLVKEEPAVIDDEQIKALELPNCESIGNNSYRGAMFSIYNVKKIPKIKEAGIKQIVDLTGDDDVKKACKKYGLKYLVPPSMDCDVPAFKSDLQVKRESMILNRDIRGFDKETVKRLVDRDFNSWKEETRDFIDKFVNFIRTMEEGNLYIGCDFGTYRTDEYVFYNYMFNPKAKCNEVPHMEYMDEEYYIDSVENLYYNLTEEDKKKMGWTKEFDKEFVQKINKYKEFG